MVGMMPPSIRRTDPLMAVDYGLPKSMDFNQVDQRGVASAASRRNHIPRKSLNYQTPLKVFLSYMDVGKMSSLF